MTNQITYHLNGKDVSAFEFYSSFKNGKIAKEMYKAGGSRPEEARLVKLAALPRSMDKR
jgi:hypothetical protein